MLTLTLTRTRTRDLYPHPRPLTASRDPRHLDILLLWDPKFGGREATTGNASAVRRLVGPRSPSINVTISRQKNDFAFACNTYFGPKTLVACDQ